MTGFLLWLALAASNETFTIQRFGLEELQSVAQSYEAMGDFILFTANGVDAKSLKVLLDGKEITENVHVTYTDEGDVLQVPITGIEGGTKKLTFLSPDGSRIVHTVRINPSGVIVHEEGESFIED